MLVATAVFGAPARKASMDRGRLHVDGAWSTSRLPRLLTSGSKVLPDSELTGWMLNLGMKQQLLRKVQINFTPSLSRSSDVDA